MVLASRTGGVPNADMRVGGFAIHDGRNLASGDDVQVGRVLGQAVHTVIALSTMREKALPDDIAVVTAENRLCVLCLVEDDTARSNLHANPKSECQTRHCNCHKCCPPGKQRGRRGCTRRSNANPSRGSHECARAAAACQAQPGCSWARQKEP